MRRKEDGTKGGRNRTHSYPNFTNLSIVSFSVVMNSLTPDLSCTQLTSWKWIL